MPLPPLTTPDQVISRVADAMNMTPTRLVTDAPAWSNRAANGTTSAIGLVERTLVSKGYTAAQVAADPQIQELCTRVAVCHAVRESLIMQPDLGKTVEAFCKCEEELANWPVLTPDLTAVEAPIAKAGRITAYDAAICEFRRHN